MKERDGDSRSAEGGAPKYKTKKRLGGKGLSLEKFVGANRIKPIVTASQIRKQREVYQNSKKVNKYRKTLKHLAAEGHEFKPRISFSIDAEILDSDLGTKGEKENPSPDLGTKGEKENPSPDLGTKGEKESPSPDLGTNGEKENPSPDLGTKGKKENPSPAREPEAERDGGKKDQGKKFGRKGRQPNPPSHLERLREEYEKKKQEEEEIRKEKRALFEEQQAARENSKKERKEVQKKFRKTTGNGQPVMKHRMEHLLESIQRDMK